MDAGRSSHTVIRIYTFVVSGSESVTTSLINRLFLFLLALPLLLSICSFNCLKREVTGATKPRQLLPQKVCSTAESALWDEDGGGGVTN